MKQDDDDREENHDDEGEDEDDECHAARRSRRSRPNAGRAERTSGGSGADEEYLDTDDNDTISFDDENNPMNKTINERRKIISEEDTEFMKAFDTLVAESVAVRFLFII